ncbi:NADH dehydrogenase subunit L [Longilinea arvoryzae]|uniref:NADH dehydrogenase subunit L n=1 Tax=Longilinea arvoryzae TaxID=360412 RepID=A0A0S7BMZ7_9CHLR|nr:NADH-quinone oxidoreductase subunit L [Longilinea arvoryzae]GAP15894.1 NADH dehydrogenase subunit L [Longilinea arvoryzae]
MHLETILPDPIFALAPWVVFLPAIGLILNLLVGKRLGEKGIGAIASLASGGAFGVAVALTLALARHPAGATVPLLNWITIGDLSVNWAFRVDTLAVTMMLVVSGVGTIIHIYSIGYMHSDVRHNGDPQRFRRFFVYLNLFITLMMILVSADNYLMLFVGWEGVGLCSYLLIGFWFEKGKDGIGNALAAKKAFIVNRIGDFGLLLALFFLFWNFHSFDFATIFAQAPQVAAAAPWVVLAITLFMLLGVTGKSAQIPLYVWLPDAMAGPTPVSALIHAATMVTAGVYLVARSQALFTLVPAAQTAVTWVGAGTALFAATIAVGQYDIKKVLAYSTISQLGFMVAAVGMGATVAGMFHLVTHSFFKALLFLSAGSVILGMEHGAEHGDLDLQDMRNMGGLRRRMPLTFWVYLIGALALAGVAPLAGFFSKDEILAAASRQAPAVFIVLVIAAFFTAFYMGRQVLMVFFGQPRSPAAGKAVESPALVTVPLVGLALLSIGGGALNLPGISTLETWLEHSLNGVRAGEFLLPVAAGSLGVALLGIGMAWWIYGRRPLADAKTPDPLARSLGPVYRGMERKWNVDELYHWILVRPYQALSAFLAGPVDQGLIDGLVNGIADLLAWLAGLVRRLQTGYVRTYAFAVLVGVVAVLAYLATVAGR